MIHIGAVHLRIANLAKAVAFYEERLGFAVQQASAGEARLGAGGPDLLVLHEAPAAPRASGTTGLYHFAVLVPSRRALAQSLRRLVESNTVLQGAADHGVSEALYLADPDGNGIEIYRDRPREEWPFVNGRLQMGADPLDFEGILAERADAVDGLRPGTTIGHVHLHVAHLDAAYRFYVDVLGLDLMQRYGPSALFVSSGGYHHHIGLNTWAGVGAPPPPAGAIGLQHFEIRFPSIDSLTTTVTRIRESGIPVDATRDTALLNDPSSNGILLSAKPTVESH